jgi:hypothetical protein
VGPRSTWLETTELNWSNNGCTKCAELTRLGVTTSWFIPVWNLICDSMIQKWKQWWHQEWYKHKCKMHSPWLITWGEKNISLPSKLTGSNQWRWLNAYLMKPDKAARLAELLVKAPNMYIIRYGSWCSLQASNVPHAIKPMIHDDPCIAEHPAITMANDWLIHPFFSDHGTSPNRYKSVAPRRSCECSEPRCGRKEPPSPRNLPKFRLPSQYPRATWRF